MRLRLICLLVLFSQFSHAVDLNDEQLPPQALTGDTASTDTNVFNKRWYQKIDISGTLSMWYEKTGGEGSRPQGSWNNKEAIFWITGQVWEDIEAFVEWYPLQTHGQYTGESYIHFKNLIRAGGENRLSMKVGRFDLPYGEEYLAQDAIDNPLIARTAAFPWGWDGGVMLYGTYNKVGWIATMTDGKFVGAADADNDKANEQGYSAKIYGQVTPWLYSSISYLKAGQHGTSAFWIGNNGFIKSGTVQGAGTGATPAQFNATELDIKLHASSFDMLLNYGVINIEDVTNSTYNRKLTYWAAEPVYTVNENWYVAARYSRLGADGDGYKMATSSNEGTYTNFNPAAATNTAGKVKEFSLTSAGIGYKPNFNTKIVLEYTTPKLTMGDSVPTTFDPMSELRNQWGLKFATKF